MKGGEDLGLFAMGWWPVPVGCHSILIARLQGDLIGANSSFAAVREQMNQKIQKSPQNAAPLLSQLAVVDALLGKKEVAISEAKRAIELFPISNDALRGPRTLVNLAVVYAWTNELDLAFATLDSVTKTPFGIYYGELKLNPFMVRLGYAHYGNPYEDDALKAGKHVLSGGLGFRDKGVFIDLTYVHTIIKDVNFPYRVQPPKQNTYADLKSQIGQILLTFGFKL